MKVSKIVTYLLYVVIMFSSLAFVSWAIPEMKLWVAKNYTAIPYLIGTTVLCIFIGLLMGLEYLIKEFLKDGKWSVNIIRLIILGVPSGISAFYVLIYFTIRIPTLSFILSNTLYSEFSGIFFGYIIMTSFYKNNRNFLS